ncbi:MAG: methanogenesis marker 16 metalloprotein [archaeon]|nr:methanogenesis marker 16 metalloprotein [archaeon]
MPKERTIEEIKNKISDGSAVVMTAQEICMMVQSGKKLNFEDVDVVTTATKGLMSGTSAIMAFRIGEPGEFIKVKELTMNDIQCYVGPCPNETLGLVDLILYATDVSKTNPKYGAGHLLRDLVEGKSIKIRAIVEGKTTEIEKTLTINDIYFAQVMGIRHAFKNYNAFVNPSEKPYKSIFTVIDLEPNSTELTFCGVGAVNPLENDPKFEILGEGSPILVNGALGHIIGAGTRSSQQRPNIMTIAPLFDMKPEYMGGFITARGPEVICSIAAAIPILDEKIFNNLKLADKNVKLNVVDIVGRKVLEVVDYGQVWKRNLDINVTPFFKNKFCDNCELITKCPVEIHCPTFAFKINFGIDETKCFNCGTCLKECPKGAFLGDLGEVKLKDKTIPVTLRQSDRKGAVKLMNQLKDMIIKGEFPINKPVAKPKIYIEKTEEKRESAGGKD